MAPKIENVGEILTQDNRATAHPIFYVRERLRVFGMDPNYGEDDWVWIHCDDCEEVDEDKAKELNCQEAAGEEIDDCWSKIYYWDIWEIVQPFFLESNAQAYIDANRHNLNDPHIYAGSGYRNYEWQAIREMLKEIANGTNDSGD